MCPSNRRGFTLIELLVVIGILALLLGILLPSLVKARNAAMRTQDLSNIRQIVTATVAYAATSKGVYPLGTATWSYAVDDMSWTGSDTFDYFLQFCNTGQVTSLDLAANPQLERVMSCNSALNSLPTVNMFNTIRYNSSPTVREMMMGWIYWGNRAVQAYIAPTAANPYPVMTPAQPVVLDPRDTSASGPTLTGEIYQMPNRQGQQATTRTLVTCFANDNTAASTTAYLPHRAHSSTYGMSLGPLAGNPFQIASLMDGLCMGYTDGSARYVPPGDMGAIGFPYKGAGPHFYYDATAR